MVEIPDSLRSLFIATVHERDGSYIVEISSQEVTQDAVTVGETYRVALLEAPTSTAATGQDAPQSPGHGEGATSILPTRRLMRGRYAR